MVADYHISNFLKINDVEIKWICDTSAENLTRTAKKYNLHGICTDYKHILHDKFINAVVICTSPNRHCQIGIESIQAKKHVLLEKPIAVTREETHRFYDEANKNPEVIILECSSRHSRLQPKFLALKKSFKRVNWGTFITFTTAPSIETQDLVLNITLMPNGFIKKNCLVAVPY